MAQGLAYEPLGQKTMAQSEPVVIASDQTPVPISGTITTTPSGTQDENLKQVNGVTVNVGIGTASTGTQRVAVSSDSFPAVQPVSGTVAISNFPATQPVSGTVTANQGTSPWIISGTVVANPTTPTTVLNGQVTVAVTNTAIVISGSASVSGVIVQALAGNVGNVVVGANTVTTANGFQLQPGQATSVAIDNLNKIFVNGTSGDGVCFIGS